MSELTAFDFNGNAVRAFEKEGEFCFVAKDVCDCLGLSNHKMAVQSLDDDEKGVSSTYHPVTQTMLYVTESGLYTLTLRSRKAVTPGTPQHRFRKWVTSEVLPSLRKTGAYAPGRDIIAVPTNVDRVLLNNELNARTSLLREARNTFGREAAMALWGQLGLPDIARDGVNAAAGTSRDDGEGCLKHLLNFSTGQGVTVRQMLSNAIHDREVNGAHRFGFKLNHPNYKGCILIANSHPFLAEVFEATQWADNWRDALASLSGAGRAGVTRFGKRHARCVAVPLRHFDWQ